MTIFVIIVAYNGMEWYDRCLQSLFLSPLPLSIIVVDNASTDGTANYLRNKYPQIILIESQENLGFGKGNNLGLIYALEHDCDYVFLLNQDAWLKDNNTIGELIHIHKSHPEYGILSPMHLRANETELGMLWENNNNLCSKRLVSDLYCGTLNDIYETNYVNAAAWLLPRNTLETVGGFDPVFQHYEEDDDYLNRVRFHKLKIGICPSIRIIHDHRVNTKNPFKKNNLYHHEQELMVKLNDINSTSLPVNYILYYLRKMFKNIMTGNVKSFQDSWRDCKFVIRKRKIVSICRNNNSQIGRTWL